MTQRGTSEQAQRTPPSGVRRWRMGWRDESGSVAVELVIVTPVLILFLLFVVGLGRLATARLDVDGAASQAARAASIATAPAVAVTVAQQAATAALGSDHVTCDGLTVSTDTSDFVAGGWVAVTVTCTVDMGDLTGIRFPAAESVSSRAQETIDTYRDEAS